MTPESLVAVDQPVSFVHPPVSEVVFAVQFTGDAIDLEVLGGLATQVKARFPLREQHPPLFPMSEDFGVAAQGPQIVFKTEPELPRTWFVTEDGVRLVQAQADRFAFNWRRRTPDQQYPRYKALRDEFIKHLEAVIKAVTAVNPSAVPMNVCELTYVNELAVSESQPRSSHPPLGRFLRALGPLGGPEFLPEAEDARLQARWQIPAEAGDAPRGRLYASAEPAYRRNTNVPIYLLTMTARMVGAIVDAPAAFALLDVAHDWIVRGFKDLTTAEMHGIWQLEEGSQ